jgi:hypothetical protein
MNEYNNPSFATMFQRAFCTHSLFNAQQDALTQYKGVVKPYGSSVLPSTKGPQVLLR